MIDLLKKNIESEIAVVKELALFSNKFDYTTDPSEKKHLEDAVDSLKLSLKIINDSIPDLLNSIDYPNKLSSGKKDKASFQRVLYEGKEKKMEFFLKKGERRKIIQELDIGEDVLSKIRGKKLVQKADTEEFKATRGYLKVSNKLFLDRAVEMIKSNYFKSLYIDIKKSNLEVLFETYIAMMIFTTIISFFVGVLIMMFFLFFTVGLVPPSIQMYGGDFLPRLLKLIWIPIVVPVGTFVFLFFYPSTERDSIEKRINSELPFAVIHMNAVSGSGIAPEEIFKIIAVSNEYPYLRKEMKKILNQMNVYGFDLVSAINNVAKVTPSKNFAELLAGITTTINSGGDLSEFFERRAETLLLEYRLDREKFAKVAETFMDVYISLVIAAPMVLVLLLIMLGQTGFSLGGLSVDGITFLVISIIVIMNVMFLGFLQVKQPSY